MPATATKVKLYGQTLDLVKSYNERGVGSRQSITRAFLAGKKGYLDYPLSQHIWVLSQVNPQYRGLFMDYQRFLQGLIKPDEFYQVFFDALEGFYKNKASLNALRDEVLRYEKGEIEHPSFATAEEHEELAAAESLPSEGARVGAMENFTQTRLPQLQTPAIHVPYVPVQGPANVHLPGGEQAEQQALHLGGGPTLGAPTEAEQKAVVPEAFRQWKDIQQPFTPAGHEEFKPPQTPPLTQPSRHPEQPTRHPELVSGSRFRNKFGMTPRLLTGLRNIKLPQGLTLPIGKFIRKNVTLTRVASVFTGGLGAFLGGTTTGTALGTVGGGIIGGSLPTLIKQQGFGNFSLNLASRVGHGSADFIGGISSGGSNLRAGVSRLGSGLGGIGGGPGKKAAIIFLLGFLFLSVFLVGFAPPGATPPPGGPPITGGGGDIAQCTFYRSGDGATQEGLKFRIPQLPALISDISSKVGIPAAVLAGFLRVECGTCFYTPDPSYITNDYDAHFSLVRGVPFAFGIVQFYPPTFKSVFDRNKDEVQRLFNKTGVQSTVTDSGGAQITQDRYNDPSDPFYKNSTENMLRMYSIRDSLIAAAFKIKEDAKSAPPYDRPAIDRIVGAYFTSCEYIQEGRTFNYCEDIWRSYQQCRPTPAPPPPTSGTPSSCPIDNGRISCGSYEGIPGKVRACHCAADYPPRQAGTLCSPLLRGSTLTRTGKSIDVMPAGRNGQPGDQVKLPTIEGQPLKWQFLGTEIDSKGFGFLRLFKSDPTPRGIWSLYMIHVDQNNPSLNQGTVYNSGEIVAQIGPSQDHVHINIGLNIANFCLYCDNQFDTGWMYPDKDLNMCVN